MTNRYNVINRYNVTNKYNVTNRCNVSPHTAVGDCNYLTGMRCEKLGGRQGLITAASEATETLDSKVRIPNAIRGEGCQLAGVDNRVRSHKKVAAALERLVVVEHAAPALLYRSRTLVWGKQKKGHGHKIRHVMPAQNQHCTGT